MVEVLCGIFFLACVGFVYGLVLHGIARRDGDAERKKKSIKWIDNSIAFGLASLVGFWCNSVGLLLNGWVLAGCLLGPFIVVIPLEFIDEEFEKSNRFIFTLIWVIRRFCAVVFALGLELVLIRVFPDGVGVGDIIMLSLVGLWLFLIVYCERLDKQERREREAKKQRTEQLEETLRESLVTVGKVPDGVDWNELEPVLRELTIRKMEALSEEEKREAYEMFLNYHTD